MMFYARGEGDDPVTPRYRFLLCATALALLAACDKTTSNSDKDTFQTALQAYYDSHPICVSIPLTFPVELSRDGDDATKQQLNPLVTAGVISVTTIQKNEPAISGNGRPVNYLRYAPIASQNAVRKGANSFLGGSDICFARRKIVNIESFTAPADAAGVKVTRVTYAYELKDVAPWARKPDIAKAFPQIGAMLAKPANRATDGLVQTDSGWKQENDTP